MRLQDRLQSLEKRVRAIAEVFPTMCPISPEDGAQIMRNALSRLMARDPFPTLEGAEYLAKLFDWLRVSRAES